MVYIMLFVSILLWTLSIFTLVLTIKWNSKDNPIDDSSWNIDKTDLYNKLRQFISNPQEKIYAVLNIQNALNVIQNGISEEGFAILTDRACYFIGKIYEKKGIFTRKANVQHRIVVSEMKGVRVGTLSRIRMLIPYILSTALLILQVIWSIHIRGTQYNSYSDSLRVIVIWITTAMQIIMLSVSLYCFLQVFLVKRTNICIEFTSMTVAFMLSSLGAREIKDFYKAVSTVQGLDIMNPAPTQTVAPMQNIQATGNKVERLSELSKLFDQGMISAEEFNQLKAEVINKQ